MHDAPSFSPLKESDFYPDGQSQRMPVANTVARGALRTDTHFYDGRINGALADTFPMPVDNALMQLGRERFNIFCSPCHGRSGKGDGMVVQRGFRAPSSFHVDRLREASPGYYFDVMTRGFGAMQDYAAHIPPRDRWAIAAYIRALQLSQNARVDDVPPEKRADLK